jgi:hypothetical protein
MASLPRGHTSARGGAVCPTNTHSSAPSLASHTCAHAASARTRQRMCAYHTHQQRRSGRHGSAREQRMIEQQTRLDSVVHARRGKQAPRRRQARRGGAAGRAATAITAGGGARTRAAGARRVHVAKRELHLSRRRLQHSHAAIAGCKLCARACSACRMLCQLVDMRARCAEQMWLAASASVCALTHHCERAVSAVRRLQRVDAAREGAALGEHARVLLQRPCALLALKIPHLRSTRRATQQCIGELPRRRRRCRRCAWRTSTRALLCTSE